MLSCEQRMKPYVANIEYMNMAPKVLKHFCLESGYVESYMLFMNYMPVKMNYETGEIMFSNGFIINPNHHAGLKKTGGEFKNLWNLEGNGMSQLRHYAGSTYTFLFSEVSYPVIMEYTDMYESDVWGFFYIREKDPCTVYIKYNDSIMDKYREYILSDNFINK